MHCIIKNLKTWEFESQCRTKTLHTKNVKNLLQHCTNCLSEHPWLFPEFTWSNWGAWSAGSSPPLLSSYLCPISPPRPGPRLRCGALGLWKHDKCWFMIHESIIMNDPWFYLRILWPFVTRSAYTVKHLTTFASTLTGSRDSGHILGDSGGLQQTFVDFKLRVPPCCTPALPMMPYFLLPRRSRAGSGTLKLMSTKACCKPPESPSNVAVL